MIFEAWKGIFLFSFYCYYYCKPSVPVMTGIVIWSVPSSCILLQHIISIFSKRLKIQNKKIRFQRFKS